MIKIRIDDSQIMDFAKKSPQRARWATAESLKMGGGHTRKKMREWIEKGGENWPPLSHPTKKLAEAQHRSERTPLFGLGRFVRFKYSNRGGNQQVRIGFMNTVVTRIAKTVQYGKRIRVTPSLREHFARRKIFLRKSTTYLNVPPRPIIEPFWRREERETLNYIEKKFFEKFFSKQKPNLRY
ncbi:MAG: hypothetical protein JXB42_01735 [Deltaproteobacteria bacterium]|nr:hypothetical protein [Deltaproteobacteria bacterium]